MPRTIAILAGLLLAAVSLRAEPPTLPTTAPPTDEQVQRVVARYKEAVRALAFQPIVRDEDAQRAAREALGDLRVEELFPRQIALLLRASIIDLVGATDAARDRLETFAGDDGVDGLVARMHTLLMDLDPAADEPPSGMNERILAFLDNESLDEAVRLDAAPYLFEFVDMLSPDELKERKAAVFALSRLINERLPDSMALSQLMYFITLFRLAETDEERDTLERVRVEAIGVMRRAQKKAEGEHGYQLTRAILQLESDEAKRGPKRR